VTYLLQTNGERLLRKVDFAGELIASGYKFARMRALFLGDRFAREAYVIVRRRA